jgi:hypothetical protein
VNEHGRRCTERQGLEFHHCDPFGRGGDHDHENITLMCRAHNIYLAERDYGKEVMKKYRGKGGRVSEPTPIYFTAAQLQLRDWRSHTDGSGAAHSIDYGVRREI